MRGMLVYLLLILALFFTQIISVVIFKKEKTRKIVLLFVVLSGMFLLCALRNTSVGYDTAGYAEVYAKSKTMAWSNNVIFNFEPGYVMVNKLFSKLGFSFNQFLIAVYLMVFIPVGIFIYNNSKRVYLSLLIYICFTYFTFNLTGIRNSISLSLILLAYETLKIKKWPISTFLFILLIGTACLFHRTAFIIAPLLILSRTKINFSKVAFGTATLLIAFIFKSQIYTFINDYLYSLGEPASNHLGGRFYAMVGIEIAAIFFLIKNRPSEFLQKQFFKIDRIVFKKEDVISEIDIIIEKRFNINDFAIIVFWYNLILTIVAGDTILARVSIYVSIFICILIPNFINAIKSKSLRTVISVGVIVAMIGFYYLTVLRNGQFGVTPYKFYWQ